MIHFAEKQQALCSLLSYGSSHVVLLPAKKTLLLSGDDA